MMHQFWVKRETFIFFLSLYYLTQLTKIPWNPSDKDKRDHRRHGGMKRQSWDHVGCTVLIDYFRMQLCIRKCWPVQMKKLGSGLGCMWLSWAGSPRFCPQHHKPVIPALEKWNRDATHNSGEFQDKLDPTRPHLEGGRGAGTTTSDTSLVSTRTCPHKKLQTITKYEGRKTICPLSCPFCSPTSPQHPFLW